MKPFHLGAASGVIAATTSGVIFAFRNPGPNLIYVQRFRFDLADIALPTGLQELSLALFLQSVFSANYSGGTACGSAARSRLFDTQRVRRVDAVPVTQLADANVMIATTTNLTAGGGDVVDTQPWARRGQYQPAATAGVWAPSIVLEWANPAPPLDHEDPKHGCMILLPDTGFNVTLPVALGAAHTARLSAEIDWVE